MDKSLGETSGWVIRFSLNDRHVQDAGVATAVLLYLYAACQPFSLDLVVAVLRTLDEDNALKHNLSCVEYYYPKLWAQE